MAFRPKRSKLQKPKAVKSYNDKFCQELADVIETLTHSGNKILDQNEFNKVRNICRRSDEYVKEAYNMIMDHLKENHAQVRRSAFQIIDEMFRRSHCFRELLISNIEQMVELTLGKVLPPPACDAQELRELTVRSLHQWHTSFGQMYKKLNLSYDYLCRTKKDAFSILDATGVPSRGMLGDNTQHQENINKIKIKRVLAEIKDKEIDIKAIITSLSNCINLLLPHPDDFFIVPEEDEESASTQLHPTELVGIPSDGDSDKDGEPDDTGLREVGIHSVNHSVELDFMPSSEAFIKETPDNSDVIQNARESAKLIKSKYLPMIKTWLEDLVSFSENEEVQRRLVELKGDMDDVIFKYNRMIFIAEEDVSSDSDLEEVVESRDMNLPSALLEKPNLTEESEPSKTTEGTSRKEKLLAIAPKRPFDVDLYHWEDEKLPVPTLIANSTEGHRFWVGADSSLEEIPVPGGSAALRTRVIEFSGSFSPVSHTCRVRLPSGKLCPRRDRHKCPFHGEIVPRDEVGNCINPRDAIRMQQLAEKQQQEKPDWQNPKLLAEIKKTTGIDLKMPEKGRRKRKERKHPGLTDLKELENTATKRLEKKVFKKSSMRKVAAVMDGLDKRKFTDKFGDQFNYFFNT